MALAAVTTLVLTAVSPGPSLPSPDRAYAAFNCALPRCTPPLLDHGGPVVHDPRVYLVFWGHLWSGDPGGVVSAEQRLFRGLAGAGGTYNDILTDYHDDRDYVHIDTVLAGSWTDTADPAGTIDFPQLAGEAAHASAVNGWSNSSETVYFVLTQSGTPTPYRRSGTCGYHVPSTVSGATYLIATALWPSDQAGCLNGFGGGNTADAVTVASSHEYAETVTDPMLDAWRTVDPAPVEIGDLCEGLLPAFVRIPGVGSVQFLYDDATGRCDSGLTSRQVVPPRREGALSRYSGSAGHWTTSGSVTSGFTVESSLGFSLQSASSLTTAVYECRPAVGAGHFTTTSSLCEGTVNIPLRLEGWLFTSPPPSPLTGTAVYRCRAGIDHFDSTASGCEGQIVEGLLGYALTEATLGRYTGAGYHQVSSGQVNVPYRAEEPLGTVMSAPTGGAPVRPIYNCLVGGGPGYMTSTASTCEGTQTIGLSGYVYTTPPPGASVLPLWRCRAGADHFVSNDPGCEGQVAEYQLGYIRQSVGLARYAAPGDHWSTTTGMDDAHSWDSMLGYLFAADPPDSTAPLYACITAAGGHFTSPDPGCEGNTRLALDGYVYTTPQPGTAALYRCVLGLDHFDTLSSGCEDSGGTNELTLGYVETGDEG